MNHPLSALEIYIRPCEYGRGSAMKEISCFTAMQKSRMLSLLIVVILLSVSIMGYVHEFDHVWTIMSAIVFPAEL